MAFQVSVENLNGWAVLRANGEIDLATVDLLDKAVGNALDEGLNRVIIDLSQVSFMDSTGIRSLLGNSQRVTDSGGELSVVLSGGSVARTLSVTGVDSLLRIFDTLSEATA